MRFVKYQQNDMLQFWQCCTWS